MHPKLEELQGHKVVPVVSHKFDLVYAGNLGEHCIWENKHNFLNTILHNNKTFDFKTSLGTQRCPDYFRHLPVLGHK